MSQHWPLDPELLERLPDEDAVAVRASPGAARGQLTAEGYVPELLERCAVLHAKDKGAERNRTLLIVAAVCCGIGGLVVLFAAQHFVVSAVLGGVAIACGIAAYLVHTRDIEDRQLEIISGVLKTFAPELRANRTVSVWADFTSHHKTTPTSSEKLAGGFFTASVHAYVWKHPWLRLTLPLADGSTARLELATHLKRKTKRKRKYTKFKDKLIDLVTVQIVPPKGKSFPAGMPISQPRESRLSMTRGVVKPRAAVFTYRSLPAHRTKGRGSWVGGGLELLFGSSHVVAALIQSYKAVASANRGAGDAT